MKRDMDLLRTVLLEVEKLPFDGGVHEIDVSGRSTEEVHYHIMLAHEFEL
ncbi:MAG: DUF2513 domain-containing protein [Terriglobia bacterium]|nr:DUF2513 domain-containing protein [Terriglobia bacterium]